MATITNPSSPVSIFHDLISYILTDSNDSIFNELASNSILNTEPQENQETSSKGLKRTIEYLDQPATKKSLVSNPSTSSENSVTMSSKSKRELIDAINRIYEKVNACSLEKIQRHYANQLNVDLQEIKNIYSAVSTHCLTANKISVINTKTPLSVKNSVIIPPEFKKELVNAINRNFNKIKVSHLEKIQIHYANQLNVDLQEVKNVYLAVSSHCSTVNKTSVINTKAPLSGITRSSRSKRELVDSINQLHEKASALSFEKIQRHYANQLDVDLQEVKNIYSAVSTHCPTANKFSVVNTKSPLPSIIMDPAFKKELVDSINRIFHTKKRSLEEIQILYAHQLDVSPQEVKNIYSAVSTHCPTANLPSKVSLSVKSSIIMPPELKENLVNAINRAFDEIKAIHLEKIQTYYAKQFKLDLQEVKNIYFFVSPHDSVTERVPNELKSLDLKLKVSSTDTILIISPAAKKNLVDNITYLVHTTDVSLEEIQIRYAKQFKIAPQDIEDIYLAVSTNGPSANEPSEIKQIGSLKDPM